MAFKGEAAVKKQKIWTDDVKCIWSSASYFVFLPKHRDSISTSVILNLGWFSLPPLHKDIWNV